MNNKEIEKIKTGIEGFDAISHGGLPQNRSTLMTGTSGSCKTLLAIQYILAGIRNFKETGVFVTFEETPVEIKKNMLSFNWDLDQYEKENKLAFVDLSPDPRETKVTVTGEYDLSALMVRIEHAIKKVKAKRVAVDSIGSIFSQINDHALIRRELLRIFRGIKLMGVTTLVTAERLEEYGPVARYGIEEFVADNVIILRNILSEEKRRRTIEILKYRGAKHQNGEFPFTISDEGVEILTLSSMKLTMKSSEIRISSGNKELDKMCSNGFFRDSIILISGATGTGKTLLTTTFINEGCKNKEKCLLFAFEESRAQLLRNAIGWGMDFSKWEQEGMLKIICEYPETKGLSDHLLAMKKEIETFNPHRIAMDSLSALERVSTGKDFREFVVSLSSFIKERETAGLFTAVTPSLMGGVSITEQHISTITDSIILLRYVEMMGKMHRGITVLKMRGSWHDKSIREFEIDEDGITIGNVFENVGGIISGLQIQSLSGDLDKMGKMFD
ncbi:MAG: circadian clock protein KaiC [Spirochaetes bacterium]|nr:circadian clock protein KaiC [Spirochaetota bacterium]